MADVLLTHSYFYRFDTKQWKAQQPYPPLGTLLAAAVVRAAGFSVSLFDTNLKLNTAELKPVLDRERPRFFIVYDDGFNYLTKMCLTNMREAAFQMIDQARQTGCTIIVCSSDSTDRYESYLTCGADFIIRGEGEETLRELLERLRNKCEVHSLAGIAYRENGEMKVNANRPVIKNLDELPLPAWDLVDIASYKKIWQQKHGYFSLNLATTRGCPFKCNWCAKPIYGNRYHSRSPQHVVREIEFLLQHYQPDHFWMCDDIFGLKPGWVTEFRQLVRSKNLSFKYKIQSRVDLLDVETVEALAQSGAATVWVGAESGSQKVLDAMDKGITLNQIYEARHLLKRHGIRAGLFLQFGYLGEQQKDIDATIKMLLDLMPDEIGISVSYPLPGTGFYEKVKDQLKEKQNWSDSDDLAMMFQGTYSKSFYRELHRYVHSLYGRKRGINSLKKLIRAPWRLTYSDLRSGLATLYYAPASLANGQRVKKLAATT